MTRSDRDSRMLDRFLDNALSGGDLSECRHRLEREPALRTQLQERKQLRRCFAAGRDQVVRAPAGFAGSVIAAARRMPTVPDEPDGDLVAVCKRLLLVAAAVLTASVIWHSGLCRGSSPDTLQAAPDETKQVIELLDAKVRLIAEPNGK